MDTTNKLNDNDGSNTRDVYVQFIPSAEIKMFTASPATTIRDLKIVSETKCGIPSDVLVFMHNGAVLDDSTVLLDLDSSEYLLLDLFIQPLWDIFIHSCFKGDKERIMARVHIRMNQLNHQTRAFVAAFIAAQKGNSDLFQLLIESFKEEVMHRTVRLSGRSLLHAAVLGGNISCVMTLVINGGWELLNRADQQQEVPLDMAQRMKKEDGLVQILKKYNDMYIHRHRENDYVYERESSQSDETIDRDGKRKNLSGDDGNQDERLPGSTGGSSTAIEVGQDILVPKPPTQGRPEAAASGRGHRLLERSEKPRFKLYIPTAGEPENKETKYPSTSPTSSTLYQVAHNNNNNNNNNNNKRTDSVKLPGIHAEGRRSPCASPRSPRGEFVLGTQNRRGSSYTKLERARSPSSPTPRTKHSPPKLIMQRPRTRSEYGGELRCDVKIKRDPQRYTEYLSSSAPSSPTLLRKRQTLPTSSLARPTSPSGYRTSTSAHQDESRLFSHELQMHLLDFDKTRETLPWNVWRKVVADDSSRKSSDEEIEEERIRKYQQMSGHHKSFDVWLTAKEEERVKKHAEAESEARRLAEEKALEEMQRRMKAKSFSEWLKEKETKVEENEEADVTEAESEARRAQASFKYQQWTKKKDEEALAREEKTRAEEQRNYEEMKKRREEELRTRWLKKKIGKVNSVPI